MRGNEGGCRRNLQPAAKRAVRAAFAFALLPAAAAAGSWEIGYSFPAPTGQTNGLTWDGRTLWHTNEVNPIAYRIDPNTGQVLGTVGTQIRDQGDLEFAGGSLWIVSEDDHFVKRIDPASGRTLDSIKVLGLPPNPPGSRFPLYQLEGCTFDGRNLWLDGDHSTIIRIDTRTYQQYKYVMPWDMGYLDGMTWAFDHLWVVTNNAVIYELDPCTMGILDQFAAPANVSAGPEGFAFDGENLWFADNDRDEIYKIILKDKILTKRTAGAPPADPSGADAVRSALSKAGVGNQAPSRARTAEPALSNPDVAKSALAKAGAVHGCDEGELLTPSPVSLPGERGAFRMRSRGRLAVPAWNAGDRGPSDALGRLSAPVRPAAD